MASTSKGCIFASESSEENSSPFMAIESFTSLADLRSSKSVSCPHAPAGSWKQPFSVMRESSKRKPGMV